MKHILISGGSRGIGAATVELFASKGYKVSYLYTKDALVSGSGIQGYKCDVSNPIDVKRVVSEAITDSGEIDVLVSNAGISMTGLATDFDFEDYSKIMNTNFGGLFNLTHEILPSMVNRKEGVILAVSSMWGQTGGSCEALYSATKGAVDAYVKALAKEVGPSGIRVNAVSPGVIETDMMSAYTKEDKIVLSDETPLCRLGSAEDIAKTLFFLASDDSSFITGQILGVNGGILI